MKPRVRQLPRKKSAAISAQLAGACAAVLQEHLLRLRRVGDHPNRLLHYDELLVAHLLGFFDAAVRSLRTLDGRSVASDSENGITLQFYVMIIATLLMHLHTGARPSVYCFMPLGLAAKGDLVLEKVPEVLERLARERERRRREKSRPETTGRFFVRGRPDAAACAERSVAAGRGGR